MKQYLYRFVEKSGYMHQWKAIDIEYFKKLVWCLQQTPAWKDVKTVEWKGMK